MLPRHVPPYFAHHHATCPSHFNVTLRMLLQAEWRYSYSIAVIYPTRIAIGGLSSSAGTSRSYSAENRMFIYTH